MSEIMSGRLRENRLRYFLISLLLLMVLYPWLEGGGINSKILNLFVSVILLSGVYIASSDNRRFIIALFIALPALIASWSNTLVTNVAIALAAHSFGMLFFVFTALIILSHVLRASRITGDIICGAISVYLLIGIAWGRAFSFTEILYPGSFYIDAIHNFDNVLNASDFTYYSFTTLTTLGYGDITPVTSRARSLATLEAVTGVTYMAVLIARLVGTYILHSAQSSER